MNLQYMTIIFCGRFGGYILKYEHINIDQTLNSILVCCSLKSMKRKMSVESEKLGFRLQFSYAITHRCQ